MSAEAGAFFESVQKGLQAANVAFQRNERLVRGLDYYRHTAFEFVTDRLGAQGTVLAGGRYDGLVESLGGPATAGVGWAAGVERLAMLLDEPAAARPDVAVVVEDDASLPNAIAALARLRRAKISGELVATGSPKKRYDKAAKNNPLAFLVFGAEREPSIRISMKNMLIEDDFDRHEELNAGIRTVLGMSPLGE
jgi:histidyl-tRNA synthetase